MSIKKVDDCEYTFLIADLMVLLNGLDKFCLRIWKNGEPTPSRYYEDTDMIFLQEGIRFDCDGFVRYLFYDRIDCIEVIPNE